MRSVVRGRRRFVRLGRPLSIELLEERLVLDVSAPVILQYFEGSDSTIEKRVPDIFNAGYGSVLTPPPGRADSGNQSVGYDVYDRFDLGSPGNPTLYGTETGLKAMVAAIHQAGDSYYSDLVWNHDGFSNLGTSGFADAGGYPGFALSLNGGNYAGYNDIDGDFHSAFDNSTTGMRLGGLIDIAQEKNYQFIRNPVGPNVENLPAGTTPAYGRLANVPDPNNARFYPDTSLQPISVYDPTTGEGDIKIYPFNNASPMSGDPVAENALGYLMRYTQWMVQYIGVDGFRLDAEKHMPQWVLNYYDRAVYRSSFRTALNGAQQNVFAFGEVFDGDKGLQQSYIRKDINPNNIGVIGGNRDVLDFPLYFALSSNLTNNGLQNNWFNIVNASQDSNDDGYANNGSQGVSFVSSADSAAPYLDNVAYAFTLMRPGNAIVYFNPQEFGNRDFPKQGRGDALGGVYGNAITTLVNIRNDHPYGNYIERSIDQNVLVYERDNSMLVGLNNRLDGGYDSRTVHTNFAPGTYLTELTGNASNAAFDPFDDIPQLLQVDSNGNVNMRVPRNYNANGQQTNAGYVVYAPATPQGIMSLTNIDSVLPGQTPTTGTNATAVLSAIDVIKANTFQLQLNTNRVNLLGNPSLHDQDADGDNALFKIDGGVDVTGGGFVSTNPGDAAYGFQQFNTVHNPGYSSANGNGQYAQTINTSLLSNGLHYITVRAFRHRSSGPPIWTDFKMTIYVDRAPTVSAIQSLVPIVPGVNENQTLTVRSTDLLANNVHVLWDLPAALTNAQVISMIGGSSQTNQIDRNLWTINKNSMTDGNHVATVVSYQIDGSANVQRFAGLFTSTIFGAGLGDVNFDNQYSAADVTLFGQIRLSNNSQFNPAADMNGDGLVNNTDLVLLGSKLQQIGASAATMTAYNQLLGPTPGGYRTDPGLGIALGFTYPPSGTPALSFSWDFNNQGTYSAATGPAPALSWTQLNALGINSPGVYPISIRVGDGANTVQFASTLTIRTPTTTTVVGTPQATTGGSLIQFTATISSTPTANGGNVVFYDGGSPISGNILVSGGVAQFQTSSINAPFDHSITATFSGDLNFVGSTSLPFTETIVPPPTLISNVLNGATPELLNLAAPFTDQRSMVRSFQLTFDHPVTLTQSAVTIGIHSNPLVLNPTLPGTILIQNSTGGLGSDTIWNVTFSGANVVGGSIGDGEYDLNIVPSQVTDEFGQHLTQAPQALTFYRLFGDFRGDRGVSTTDIIEIRRRALTTSDSPDYLWLFDNDWDTSISTADIIAARRNLLKTI